MEGGREEVEGGREEAEGGRGGGGGQCWHNEEEERETLV